MAVRNDFAPGEVLASADLNDTFADKTDTSHDHSGGTDGPNIPQSSVTNLTSDLASKADDAATTSALASKFDKSGGTITGDVDIDRSGDSANTTLGIDGDSGRRNSIEFRNDGNRRWILRQQPNNSFEIIGCDSSGNIQGPDAIIIRDKAEEFLTNLGGLIGNTTAGAANVNSTSTGGIRRSTSSIKYKTQVEDLETDYADRIMQLRPVWFRSTANGDASHPEWSYYGLIAEEVADIDPRLVHFAEHDDGTLDPEGVQYDRLVPHLVSIVQRQQAHIDALTARLDAAGL